MYTDAQVNQLIADVVANLGDQGKVSELLLDFKVDYTQTLADVGTLTTEKEKLTQNNQSLLNVNNKIISQLGDISFLGEKTKKEIVKEEETKPEEMSYDNLFDEKTGELI